MSFTCKKPEVIPCNLLEELLLNGLLKKCKQLPKFHVVTVESGNDFPACHTQNPCWSCFEVLGTGFSACRTRDLL